ncbi:MAG: 2-oxoglutarate dehydrogenase E1 component [Burkholderiaceae bacterium]|nr:2-oxoglutarate dehydrogenase E1 component [Burkholderiaceae bacterium]
MMQSYRGSSYLFGGNAPYVEELYESYLLDPTSVAQHWRDYFDNVVQVPAVDGSNGRDIAHAPIVASFAERAKQGPIKTIQDSADSEMGRKRVAVQQLIAAYRNVGNRWANLDPLKRTERPDIPELNPSFYGFSDSDMDIVFNTSNTFFGKNQMTLRDLLQALRETYCGTLAAEFMNIADQKIKKWWQEKLESIRSTPKFTNEQRKQILDRLTAAEGLERYLQAKYVGQKRFSLEGGDSFIPCMDELIQGAGKRGVQEIVIGMAHRGRLNVLVNVLGKSPKDLFAEFDHTAPEDLPAGDVKYHQGFSSDISTPGGPVHLSLAFNPSHLEIVNPVVEGSARARMERRNDLSGSQVLPVLVHGDAAIAGQGVMQETLALSEVRGYSTGGTVHIVINNQIGFTTSDPRDLRSSLYCTDIMKTIDAPVLHVNGDDPEAVVLATQLALEYRTQFRKDVAVDIICFRKLGHNEQDTPAMTQPYMYSIIAKHPGTRKLYADRLEAQGVLGAGSGDEMVKAFRAAMEEGKQTLDPVLSNFKGKFAVDWSPFLNKKWTDQADTAIPLTEWKRLADRLTTIPESFKVHPLVQKVYTDRAAMGRGEINVDWGMGEAMAFASLLASGYPIRLSGEDSGRGTFSHRHSVLHDQADTNMQVVQPTTASQIFHLLRRQMIRQFRKPLIIMTPKSLLRHKDAGSPLIEFTKGEFQTVIPEQDDSLDPQKVERLIVCSGKVYYDLVKQRADKKIDTAAIVRIEQLYPFPHKAVASIIKSYPNLTELVWCQDEPQNQGAWFFVQHNLLENMGEGMRLGYAGRPASASPAVGYAHLHQSQQKALLTAAFAKLKGFVVTK